MSKHPSTQLLQSYCERRLDGAALLSLDDHITACAECRERLRRMNPGDNALDALRENLQAATETVPVHLPREQLMAYVGGRLDAVDRELAESHLEVCRQCVAQAHDLNDSAAPSVRIADPVYAPAALQARLAPASGIHRPRRRLLTSRWAGAFAVLALLLIAVALWLRTHTPSQKIADQSTASPAPSQPPTQPVPEIQPSPAPVLLTLNDGSKQITLDTQGNLTGIEALSTADMQRVSTALKTGKVLTPRTLTELRDSASPRMGVSGSKATFELLAPVGRVIASDRPTFRWRAFSGAISYRVTVTDPARAYAEIATSPALDDVKWIVDRPLKRGRLYAWQVIARTETGDVKAPEAAEARFKVLDQSIADDLARARTVYAGSHLMLGLLYAEAGLLDESEREFTALAAANPQAPIAKSLLRAVQSKLRRF